MKCFSCEKEFEVNRTHGGQNRIFCYECVPEGLTKQQGKAIRRKLYLDKANKQK